MGRGDDRRVGPARGVPLPRLAGRSWRTAATAGPARPGPAAVAVLLGRGPRGPGALAGRSGPRRCRGRPAGNRPDGPPDPDPPSGPGLGADPRALGDAGDARGPGTWPAAGHAGDTGDVPGTRDLGQDRRHAGRAERRTSVLRHRGRLVGA